MKKISISEYKSASDKDRAFLLDVRTPGEYETVHADGAVNVPLGTVTETKLKEANGGTLPKTVYVLCKSGGRATKAAEEICTFPEIVSNEVEVKVIAGGTEAWIEAELPVVRTAGKGVISLDRQVRIAAGGLVVIGSVLELLGVQGFSLLALFVGAGLVFSGVTDTCGLAAVLGKCPWNQRRSFCATK